MPLSTGKSSLEATLVQLYTDGKDLHTVEEFARRKSQAIYDFVHTGIPTTVIATFPGPVIGAMTAGPVAGTGLGGFDKPAPGMGLSGAKEILKTTLIAIWSHGNAVRTYEEIARRTAQAIFEYYDQAVIMTIDVTAGPLPAPPTAGPVAGPIAGIGGVNSTSAPGSGYDSVKGALESEFIRIWKQIDYHAPRTVPQFAEEMSEAIHAFCKEGIVNTVGAFVAPALVDPLTSSGAYFPGAGASITGAVT